MIPKLKIGQRYELAHQRKGEIVGEFLGYHPTAAPDPDPVLWLFDLDGIGQRLIRPSLVTEVRDG